MLLRVITTEPERGTHMPVVEFCARCRKEIDAKTEKYVELRKAYKGAPRLIAHVGCASQPSRPVTRYAVARKGF